MQNIRYKMEVVKTKIIFSEALDQEKYWNDMDTYYSGIVTFYARLKLLEEYTDDILSLHHLHEHGYQGFPQSVLEVKDKDLMEFLLHPHHTDVNADEELRRLIHNMMEMEGGTMMKNIVFVCQKQFQERYNSMNANDWRHLIDGYVRKVTARPELQDTEVFRFVMAG